MLDWKTLKKISDARLIKTMYLWAVVVPVVAKVFALVESPLAISMFGATLQVNFSLPFSWVAFYAASVCFTIAWCVFLGRSPAIIRDHPDFNHFLDAGKSRYQLKLYGNEVGFDAEDMRISIEAAGGQDAQEENQFQQMYWQIIKKAENHHFRSKVVSNAFYFLGFVLIASVLAQNVIFVARATDLF